MTAPAPRLEVLTPANVEAACALEVRPDQRGFVDPVATSLAEAYVWPEVAWPRLIVDGETPVGFVMAFHDIHFNPAVPDDRRSGLWRLNIAAAQQGRGYGRFAVRAVAQEIRRRGRHTRLFTTWQPGGSGPENFYLRLGFRPTGELSGGETVGALDLD
ncbi:GNAT family N-acetyltransferase [Streptomyces sp. P38-E01]|uniref:GNAT family N-acetyltransferase n=1 Tax=Streptomyces tardus TaxID=2780544 RepID=A0A949JE65_9ACTN|nr:GNAT family N-acetyltransferase [Streptomyces tardus]MBU7598433.1 GNAT family N-acetyltransferase [Streptomyces tardus]